MTNENETPWPDLLKIRDAKVHDDLGGSGRRIYTTAGNGYERKEYIRKDLSDAKDKRIEALRKDLTLSVSFSKAAAARIAELEAERDGWRDAAEHWKSERKLRERAYDLKGKEEDLLRAIAELEAKLAKAQDQQDTP